MIRTLHLPGLLLAILVFFVAAEPALADPVDLTDANKFNDDDGFGPTFAVDINLPAAGNITINEFFTGFSPWTNDPTNFGHDQIIAPGDIFSFNFVFTEPAGNIDEFSVRVFDPSTGLTVSGLAFSTTSPSSGMVTFNLTGIAGPAVLGLEFALISDIFAGDFAIDSTVVISNLDVRSSTAPIPEPASAVLLGAAGLVVISIRRRRNAAARA